MAEKVLSPAEEEEFFKQMLGRRARLTTVFADGSVHYLQTGIIGEVVVAKGPRPPGVPAERGVRVTDSVLIMNPGTGSEKVTQQGHDVWLLPRDSATLSDGALLWSLDGDIPGVPDRIDYRLE